MAHATLVVSGVKNALGVAKKRKFSSAAVSRGSSGEFILRGSANLIGAGDDHAKKVAVTFSGDQVGIQQAGRVSGSLGSVAQFGKRLGEARIRAPVVLDCAGDGFQIVQSVTFIAADGSLVPFHF